MHQAGADQIAHRSLSGVLGIATFGIGVQDQDQLVHREPGRVFVGLQLLAMKDRTALDP